MLSEYSGFFEIDSIGLATNQHFDSEKENER